MELSCPACSTRFRVPDSAIGQEGRKVRCAKCQNVWHQEPLNAASPAIPAEDPQVEVAPAPPPMEEESFSHAAAAMAPPQLDDDEAAFERRRRRAAARPTAKPKKKSKVGMIVGWLLFLIVLGGIGAGGWFFKSEVVAKVPMTAKLYELAGIHVDVPYPGFEVVPGVKTTAQEIDGKKMWLIDGEVRNIGVRPRPAPQLVAHIMAGDKPLKTWTFAVPDGLVQPGETVAFNTSVEELAGATSLSVDFVEEPMMDKQ
ncbi:zinc-ribbon domain-containing protein [Rhodovibrionaceae bacterium A322]